MQVNIYFMDHTVWNNTTNHYEESISFDKYYSADINYFYTHEILTRYKCLTFNRCTKP